MKKFLYTLLAIALCFGVGFTASFFQAGSIETWYPTLVKPALTPPNLVFPIAWGIIYVCMGLSIGGVAATAHPQRRSLLAWFSVQLLLNYLWSFNFFYLCNPLLGLVNLLLLDGAVAVYMCKAGRVRRAAAWWFAPYALWLAWATYLNVYIWMYN